MENRYLIGSGNRERMKRYFLVFYVRTDNRSSISYGQGFMETGGTYINEQSFSNNAIKGSIFTV